jgi:hypothetical protein
MHGQQNINEIPKYLRSHLNRGGSLNTQMESFAVLDSQGSRNLTSLLLPFFVTHSKYGIKKI